VRGIGRRHRQRDVPLAAQAHAFCSGARQRPRFCPGDT
jgi:hypothetical protein